MTPLKSFSEYPTARRTIRAPWVSRSPSHCPCPLLTSPTFAAPTAASPPSPQPCLRCRPLSYPLSQCPCLVTSDSSFKAPSSHLLQKALLPQPPGQVMSSQGPRLAAHWLFADLSLLLDCGSSEGRPRVLFTSTIPPLPLCPRPPSHPAPSPPVSPLLAQPQPQPQPQRGGFRREHAAGTTQVPRGQAPCCLTFL